MTTNDNLLTVMETRFDGVDQRFDGVEKRIDREVIPRLDATNGRVNRLDERMDTVEQWKEHLDGERGWQALVNNAFIGLISALLGGLLAMIFGLVGCQMPVSGSAPQASITPPAVGGAATRSPTPTTTPTQTPPTVTPTDAPIPTPLPPTPTRIAPDTAAEASWIVRPGDSLWGIARACGVPWSEIAAHNALHEPYQISAGQVIRIPGVEECE